ncbi:DUF4625 domain-containing protein [Capnocytophaga felis]|uniref:DUF4625 domain-containing protein n=1 Tax=Capnocytophaga felis TaxID=2267611 RepID=A0A5M4B659_9FLAO|nr:DUF4625 domain-containing protein [Capnocytophaga felis]GET45103.1 hypothetical protein RCZ01_04050 [Capnocytophaga felis]GET47733.1 hypothetical protein RCZ02_05640 [Capnocytophaga felis]
MNNLYKMVKATLLVALFTTVFIACDKDEKEILPEPSIEAVEIGEGNSKEVSAGQDLHIEAKVKAAVAFKEVKVMIKSEEGTSSFEVNQDYPNLVGKASGDIHSHFDVPQTAKIGKYVVSIQVTDNLGRTKEHKESLTVVAAKETPSAVKWHKMEIAFIEGHSHGRVTATSGYFHGNPEIPEVKYLKPVQKFVFENKEGKIVGSEENKPLRWQARVKGSQVGTSLYGIKIVYYDAQGNRINEQFATGNHQHFFLVEEITKNVNAPADKQLPQADKVLSFVYRDTQPESEDYKPKSPNLRDVQDPVGLKGVFEPEVSHINFNLRIVLVHFNDANPKLVGGKTRAFNELPASAQKETDVMVPVHIYTERGSNGYIGEAAKEFGVTEDDIEADEDIILEVDPHGPGASPVYM